MRKNAGPEAEQNAMLVKANRTSMHEAQYSTGVKPKRSWRPTRHFGIIANVPKTHGTLQCEWKAIYMGLQYIILMSWTKNDLTCRLLLPCRSDLFALKRPLFTNICMWSAVAEHKTPCRRARSLAIFKKCSHNDAERRVIKRGRLCSFYVGSCFTKCVSCLVSKNIVRSPERKYIEIHLYTKP